MNMKLSNNFEILQVDGCCWFITVFMHDHPMCSVAKIIYNGKLYLMKQVEMWLDKGIES